MSNSRKNKFKGNNHSQFVTHHTEEWKNNMSKKMKGRKITQGHKISKSKKGFKHSEESRKKISEAKKGKCKSSKAREIDRI